MRKKLSVFLMTVGALLIAASIALAIYNGFEDDSAADAADEILPSLIEAIPSKADNPDTDGKDQNDKDTGQISAVELDGYDYIGYLSIPSLNLELPVMSQWDYTRLKKAPCRYYGSPKTDDMVIAGHNYTRHFGKLSRLERGDEVFFTDTDGVVYSYKVADIETLPPTATEDMIKSEWALSLYTCTYSGADRITVRCERVKE